MIPFPKYFKDLKGVISVTKEKCIITCAEGEFEIVKEIQETFKENNINIDLLQNYNVKDNPLKKEVIIIASCSSEFIKKSEIDNLKNQGYIIKFKSINVILIAGKDLEGLSYGCISFTELLNFDNGLINIKKVEIRDWPDFPVRGIIRFIFTFDKPPDSRYYEIGTSNWKDIIDLIHKLKLNTIIIHSECWVGADGLISMDGIKPKYKEIIMDTIGYAHKKNIKVFMTLAHGMEVGGIRKMIGSHPCASEKETQDLWIAAFKKIVEDYSEIDGYSIHINEGARCGCDKCKNFPYSEEFVMFINKYYEILKEKNPKAIFFMVPYIGFSELIKMKRRLPKDIINFLWTDTIPKSGLPYYLEDPVNYNEYKYLSIFDRTWYWMYMNGWVDEVFHCPLHFKKCAEITKGKIEALIGEIGLYRGTLFNILALSQFSWNCNLEMDKFRKYAVDKMYKDTDKMCIIEEKYEKAIAGFLKTIWINGKDWISKKDGILVKNLLNCKKLLNSIKDVPVNKASKNTHRILREMLKIDIEILLIEIDIRLNIRKAYIVYKKGNNKDALNIFKNTYKLQERYIVLRKERGNCDDNNSVWNPNIKAGELIEKRILEIKNNLDVNFDKLNPLFKMWSGF